MHRSLALPIALLLVWAVLASPLVAQEPVTTRSSVASGGAEGDAPSDRPCISADGRFVAFDSDAGNLVVGDAPGRLRDVFVHDRLTGVTERVSVDSAGIAGNGDSLDPTISADGRFVAFASYASNLVPGDTSVGLDLFVHDRATGATERVSLSTAGDQANADCHEPILSADGSCVAFFSAADNLVASDSNWSNDVFLRDRNSGETTRASLDSFGYEGNDSSSRAALSADGRYVAFRSWASNLAAGDTNGVADIFVHDRQTGTTERVSVDSAGNQGFGYFTFDAALSGDGNFVGFTSDSDNLVAADGNGMWDVFRHDRQSGLTELVSVNSLGAQGDRDSTWPKLSADGSVVVFQSLARNLVPNDSNQDSDVFVKDFTSGLCERVSLDPSGIEGEDDSDDPWISADGRFVSFQSRADNLVAGDGNGELDVFVHDRQSGGALLSVSNLVGGGLASVSVQGATPHGLLVLAYSLAGQGESPFPWGLLNLSPPVATMNRFADATGSLLLQVGVPLALSGRMVWGQAVDVSSRFPSNTWFDLVL